MKPQTTFGKKKKEGSHLFYIQVIIERERVQINTKVSVLPADWDEKKGIIKGKGTDVSDNNLIIENIRARINQILVKYRLSNKKLTVQLFKSEFSNPSYETDFIAWMTQEIKAKKNEVGRFFFSLLSCFFVTIFSYYYCALFVPERGYICS